MSAEPPQISILDARLAEIDKRLRTIQTGLVTEPAAPADRAARTASPTLRPAPPAPPAPPASTPADPAPALPPRVEVPEPDSSLAGLRAVPAPAGGESLAEAVAQLRELAATHEDLLLSMRGLLSDYEHALTEARSAPGPAAGPAPGPAAGAAAGRAGGGGAAGEDVRSLTVAAGPFASTDAVREFKRALTALPGVSGVELRGYEGGNRAIVDVLLSLPRP